MKKEIPSNTKRLFILISIISISYISAQREPQYTQYINNTLTYNPAYISTQEDVTITALGRIQWAGFNGAPNTYSFSAILPSIGKKLGTGLNITQDQIGATKQTSISANFAYEIQLSPSIYTSFGSSIGGSFLNVNYDNGNSVNPNDPLLRNTNDFDPNFGFGVMTYTDNWYVGLSIPNFLRSNYYSTAESSLIDSDNLQFFIIGGYIFDINDNIKFKPAILSRITRELPVVVDYSANVLLNNKVTIGLSYRSSDIITGMFGIQLTNNFYVGYSYDRTISGLSGYNDGSHEIMLKFTIPTTIKTIKSPRFY
jgi:type IX secretion system PorP/SprF family membrane protein